ncbi:ChaN family lipoprotein [Rahnella victoriana]|uniref:ChaN family lipoprotein n=1 Tax=Rahnella victoriana TaxID=1510570 RepID=UPI00103E0103|nr:ChaN family lipoprotein [Rahnella victoriana]TBX30674.1 iron-regulated protein [Rahnella victoriana]
MNKFLLLAILALTACSTAPRHAASPAAAPDGVITDLRTGETLSPAQLLSKLASEPRVIVGEKHDNPAHHQIENWLVQSLPSVRPQGSVLMEMLTPDQQPKVDQVKAWLQTGPDARPARVAELINWQKSWDWSMYGDVVMTAMKAPYPLLSANLDRREIMAFYENPQFPSGTHSADPQVRNAISETIRTSHQQNIGEEQLHAMLAIQQQRDRRMAERLLAAPAPALLIAGGYHAGKSIGVPVHVKDLNPAASVTVLLLAEQGVRVDKSQADYVWITPAVAAKSTTK